MKNQKYKLVINHKEGPKIYNDISMCKLIEIMNETINNLFNCTFKINNQIIYNLQNNRPINPLLRELFNVVKY